MAHGRPRGETKLPSGLVSSSVIPALGFLALAALAPLGPLGSGSAPAAHGDVQPGWATGAAATGDEAAGKGATNGVTRRVVPHGSIVRFVLGSPVCQQAANLCRLALEQEGDGVAALIVPGDVHVQPITCLLLSGAALLQPGNSCPALKRWWVR